MAISYMTSVNIDQYNNKKDDIGWEYDETLIFVSVELTSNPIIIPDNIKQISTTLAITAGSGKVQTTTNKLADVISNTNVIWVDWDSGAVVVTTQDVCEPVTAIRFICSSGTVRLLLRAQ